MIIADRLYYLVTEVFDHYENYSGAIVIVAAVSYAVQLYMEFSGCMDIVIGKRTDVWCETAGEFQPALCLQERGRVLAQVAYDTGRMV